MSVTSYGMFFTRGGGRQPKVYGLAVAGLLAVAGHLSGSLTHGEDYLVKHAPPVLQRLAGYDWDTTARDWY